MATPMPLQRTAQKSPGWILLTIGFTSFPKPITPLQRCSMLTFWLPGLLNSQSDKDHLTSSKKHNGKASTLPKNTSVASCCLPVSICVIHSLSLRLVRCPCFHLSFLPVTRAYDEDGKQSNAVSHRITRQEESIENNRWIHKCKELRCPIRRAQVLQTHTSYAITLFCKKSYEGVQLHRTQIIDTSSTR